MKLYKDTTFHALTVEGNTCFDKAHAMWYTPSFDRAAVMKKVHQFKSINLRLSACINYVAEHMV